MTKISRYLLLAVLCAPASLIAQSTGETRFASAAAANDPTREQAIAQLEAFLSRYPQSALRPNALMQLGELLVRRADDEFATAQRAAVAGAPERPEYEPAIARLAEVVQNYPNFSRIDAAAYTLGTLYFGVGRFAESARAFEMVTAQTESPHRAEAFFRLGDALFEVASRERGEARRTGFGRAAQAYQAATTASTRESDIYFLSMYKLGWAHYNQATQQNQEDYRRAVEVFGRLVAEYDRLSPERQARLGLRPESIDYMAVAFSQVGGAAAAEQYFQRYGDQAAFRPALMRRLASTLRDQGEWTQAVAAYRLVIQDSPTDSAALMAQAEIVEIYQNRAQEFDRAQAARLELVENFAPGSAWAQANPGLATQAAELREAALRQSGQHSLASAQRTRDRAGFNNAAQLYARYLREFAQADSAQPVSLLYGEALFGSGEYAEAGVQYSRAAYGYPQGAPAIASQAGQNAIVAFDSALTRTPNDRAVQDSLFASVDRFVERFGDNPVARQALIAKGRRASEAQRWDVMAEAFRTYASRYPTDPYTPQAQKLIGDALYQLGSFTDAQRQWEVAQEAALRGGRQRLADSIAVLRVDASETFADRLVRAGEYRRAAEEVYVAFATANPGAGRAPDALRDAVEVYLLADSAARSRGDAGASREARERAVELAARLTTQYPRYQHRVTYQELQARLLGELGRREEAVAVLGRLVNENPQWQGRPDAMVRVAVMLDSMGRGRDAARAYEQFSQAYPRDARAADAQFNAAVTYLEAADTASATTAYATFAQRFPNDARAQQAQQARVALLRAGGDVQRADAELARLCAGTVPPALRAACAERAGREAFRRGADMFPRYQAMRLVIPNVAQLTQAGVQRASAQKRQMLQQMSQHFTAAIASGDQQWLSAATFYAGFAQWEYGNFLRDVQLPGTLTDEQRAAAQQGAAQQAEEFYEAARKLWSDLVAKAGQENFSNPWVDRARAAVAGQVPATPPPAGGDE